MQNQRIVKIASILINITKVLLIIYLGIEEIFKIINPSLKKSFGQENYKLTDNPIDAINYKNLVFIIILGKTKKKDLDQLNKKLKYQKSLKIGYLSINT